ncbi:hypothetical protein GOZ83_28640 [Agrobacterium vitis]|uniref:sulfotransferase domain-containing protein n=1 Tax=Rhizobium/Agrobacterium group TaxID=227290 RepID=UPI0012E866F1|nr:MULTISPECIES: sulfotransferase domain-containing protein [Rhizobium/Agrobacterium group]MCF1496256.1 sulfotransferase domain-containing protein [Allorhizobium ampelinum]MVA48977.1 hypothetical protein [Agrobacterium vitis]
MNRMVISFPKSGRTWLRYGLHLAGHGTIEFTHDGFEYNDGAKPALSFDYNARLTYYRDVDRIVYIERNTHDTIVSLFYQITGRFRDFFEFQGTISDFLRDPYFGVTNLIHYQLMWRELSGVLPVLLIRYEDMAQDYTAVLQKVSSHFELELSPLDCAQITSQTTFEAMKQVEQSGIFHQPWLQPRMGANKVREGRVGGYVEALSPEDIAYVDSELKKLGLLTCPR